MLTDQQGRPYFLWDVDMTLAELRRRIAGPDPRIRGYLIGKMLRQAKPDDALTFVDRATIQELWAHLERHLGRRRAFWRWYVDYPSHAK